MFKYIRNFIKNILNRKIINKSSYQEEFQLSNSKEVKPQISVSKLLFPLSSMKIIIDQNGKIIEPLNKSNLNFPDIPNLNSIQDLLNYLSQYKVDPKFVLNFITFSHKTENFYIVKNLKNRVIYIPKPLVKKIQKIVLKDILEKIPVDSEIVGFTKKKSIKNALEPHVAKDVVISLDIEQFFNFTTASKIYRIFNEYIGYSKNVSVSLTAITTTRVMIKQKSNNKNLYKRALPTGAPTSPYLSKLALIKFNKKLKEYLKNTYDNISDLSHTIYADNIIISFNTNLKGENLKNVTSKLIETIESILKEEGYRINKDKLKVLKKRKIVLGLCINQKINITRKYYRLLRAQVHNYSKNKDEKLVTRIRGKLNYIKFINESLYNNLFIKYNPICPELFRNKHTK